MTSKISARAVAAGLLLACAGSAQAAVMTLSSWTWGNGNAVSVTSPTYSGLAGGFSGTLSGSGVPGLDGAIQTYCVELTEHFHFGTAYGNFTVASALGYFGAAKFDRLGRLISYVMDNGLFSAASAGRKDDLSTALQLAIWNIRYDLDTTLASGPFSSSTTAFTNATQAANGFVGANALLSASAAAPITHQLWVLQSVGAPGAQDQLVWKAVPLPGTLALAGLGLAALGASVRRRRG